jgi:uncharacterized protein YceH (UPF0502 family)
VPPVALSQEQVRVLGCLVEKERTTPDDYPLTANATMRAANQTTSRHPVVDYDHGLVERTMAQLKDLGLVRFVHSPSNRATKFRHTLAEAWGVDGDELALLGLLMLRGGQTAGELKTRSERLASFPDLASVEATLGRLAARDEPLVRLGERAAGHKEPRWHQLVGDEPPPAEAGSPGRTAAHDDRLTVLEAQVARLVAQVDELRAELGLTDDPPTENDERVGVERLTDERADEPEGSAP